MTGKGRVPKPIGQNFRGDTFGGFGFGEEDMERAQQS